MHLPSLPPSTVSRQRTARLHLSSVLDGIATKRNASDRPLVKTGAQLDAKAAPIKSPANITSAANNRKVPAVLYSVCVTVTA